MCKSQEAKWNRMSSGHSKSLLSLNIVPPRILEVGATHTKEVLKGQSNELIAL